MNRVAQEIMAIAVQVANPELNVLMMNQGDDNLLVILAEKVPQTSDDEVVYVVASYVIDSLRLEPETVFWAIPTLDRARIVYEEVLRTF